MTPVPRNGAALAQSGTAIGVRGAAGSPRTCPPVPSSWAVCARRTVRPVLPPRVPKGSALFQSRRGRAEDREWTGAVGSGGQRKLFLPPGAGSLLRRSATANKRTTPRRRGAQASPDRPHSTEVEGDLHDCAADVLPYRHGRSFVIRAPASFAASAATPPARPRPAVPASPARAPRQHGSLCCCSNRR